MKHQMNHFKSKPLSQYVKDKKITKFSKTFTFCSLTKRKTIIECPTRSCLHLCSSLSSHMVFAYTSPYNLIRVYFYCCEEHRSGRVCVSASPHYFLFAVGQENNLSDSAYRLIAFSLFGYYSIIFLEDFGKR